MLHFQQMGNTITVRLPDELAEWLRAAAETSGVPRGRIVREELERARRTRKRPFMQLAGTVSGPSNLSTRKGFAKR